MMTIDHAAARRSLSQALHANPDCKKSSRPARIAISGSGPTEGDELLVRVSSEPEGFVYGHVFHHTAIAKWRALLVFSTAPVMIGPDRASLVEFRRVVVDTLDCEPVLTFRPGDASAVADDGDSAVDALTRMVAGYSDAAIRTPREVQGGALDRAIFDAYGFVGLARADPSATGTL